MFRFRKSLVALAVAGSIAFAACGSDETTTVTTPATSSDETSAAVETPAESTTPVEPAPEPVDRNQRIADKYAQIAPKELAAICSNMGGITGVSRAKSEQMFERILGPQVIRAGGEPSVVAGLLLDKC